MLNKINLNINPYIIMEMILLDCFSVRASNKTLIAENDNEAREESPKKEKQVKEEIFEKKIELPEEEKQENTEIKKIRINNCFTAADKNELNKIKNNWEEFKTKIAKQYKGLILDTMPVAASPSYVIITTSVPYLDKEINAELESIEAEYKALTNNNLKFIALSTEEWQKEKEQYILNIKKGYKYQLQEEKKDENNDSNELEELANNLFAKSKLEIK